MNNEDSTEKPSRKNKVLKGLVAGRIAWTALGVPYVLYKYRVDESDLSPWAGLPRLVGLVVAVAPEAVVAGGIYYAAKMAWEVLRPQDK